jgi:hypothetical protein
MESGIYQNGKWHIPKRKVAYAKLEKWHKPEWKVAYISVAYPNLYVKYIYVFLYNRYCITDFFFMSFVNGLLDELHQWFIGLYDEHIIPLAATVHRYTQGITQGQPCL